jgi:mannose-6-phosphate isomerase-like protein (cupin superfamily)
VDPLQAVALTLRVSPKADAMKETILRFDSGSEFFIPEGCAVVELSNRADDPDVSIARARVPPGATTRWHRVAGTAERYVILEGRGRVEVGTLDAQEVGPCDVVWIPPGCRQRITNSGAGNLIFLAICTPRFRMENYEDLSSGSPS